MTSNNLFHLHVEEEEVGEEHLLHAQWAKNHRHRRSNAKKDTWYDSCQCETKLCETNVDVYGIDKKGERKQPCWP